MYYLMVYRRHHVSREMQEAEVGLPGPVIGTISFNRSRWFKVG